MIYYPAAVFKDEGQNNYGIILPDLPGVYPVGDTVEEALADAKAAAAFHIEGLLAEGMAWETVPESIETHRQNPDYAAALFWALVEVDETAFGRQVRFNVSWPQYLLERVDACAAARHETRSGFLAAAAAAAIRG